MFLSEGIDFINKLPNVYTNLDTNNKESTINSTNLLHDIVGLLHVHYRGKNEDFKPITSHTYSFADILYK